jgi:Ser/Thr protein kinase RdoA (MazF antagonist)
MCGTVTIAEVLKAFQFAVSEEPKSIYAFSPVFKLEVNGELFIVKRTKSPLDKALRLVGFTENLFGRGIPVVTPVPLPMDNPQEIEDTVWIVYPFITGKAYSGKDEEIFEAGRLLGRIHGLSSTDNKEGLTTYKHYDFETQDILNDLQKIKDNASQNSVAAIRFDAVQTELMRTIEGQPTLEKINSRLPSVASPTDFKANNLIYDDEAKPVLIDPDNATFLPRIYDLALTLLLFHNEMATAPAEIFDLRQWKLFKQGYSQYVKLTDAEKQYWQNVLAYVYMDEVIWLMAEVPEDWENPRQVKLFESLLDLWATNDLREYNLD